MPYHVAFLLGIGIAAVLLLAPEALLIVHSFHALGGALQTPSRP